MTTFKNRHTQSIMQREDQPELWEELKTEHQWFHVVRSMILRGDMAGMGPVGWAVYCVMKAHTALNDGRSWPSQGRIAEMIGVSVDTVGRATDKLIELGYVIKNKKGNRNEYYLKESVPMTTSSGDVIASGETTYVPMQFDRFIQELKDFAKTGSIRANSPVEIKLNINIINQGDNSTVNINNVELSSDDPKNKKAWEQVVRHLNNVV